MEPRGVRSRRRQSGAGSGEQRRAQRHAAPSAAPPARLLPSPREEKRLFRCFSVCLFSRNSGRFGSAHSIYILIITIIIVFPAFARTQDAASGRPQRADGSHKSQRGERAERRSANCEAKENARKGTSGARRRPACVVHLFLVRGRAGRSLFPANGFCRFPSEGAAP